MTGTFLSILLMFAIGSSSTQAQTGAPVPELAGLDARVQQIMQKHGLPGAQVAVTYRKRLVYARGFGSAELKPQRAMQPDTLLRIGSISKPITALTLLRLQQRKKSTWTPRCSNCCPSFSRFSATRG